MGDRFSQPRRTVRVELTPTTLDAIEEAAEERDTRPTLLIALIVESWLKGELRP